MTHLGPWSLNGRAMLDLPLPTKVIDFSCPSSGAAQFLLPGAAHFVPSFFCALPQGQHTLCPFLFLCPSSGAAHFVPFLRGSTLCALPFFVPFPRGSTLSVASHLRKANVLSSVDLPGSNYEDPSAGILPAYNCMIHCIDQVLVPEGDPSVQGLQGVTPLVDPGDTHNISADAQNIYAHGMQDITPLADPGDTKHNYTHGMQDITPLIDPGEACLFSMAVSPLPAESFHSISFGLLGIAPWFIQATNNTQTYMVCRVCHLSSWSRWHTKYRHTLSAGCVTSLVDQATKQCTDIHCLQGVSPLSPL